MKVITLNIRHNVDRWEERLPLIAEKLIEEKPDIVAFQEVETEIMQAQLIADNINQAFGEELYSEKSFPRPNRTEGLAFLINRRSVHVIGYSVLMLQEGNRIAARALLEWNRIPFAITNVHLHDKPTDNESIRFEQAKEILDWLDHPGILLGDFNTEPESITIQQIRNHFLSASQSYWGKEPKSTYPTPLRKQQDFIIKPKMVDYIFFDQKQFQVTKAKIIFNESSPTDPILYPSDHVGILAEFEFNPEFLNV